LKWYDEEATKDLRDAFEAEVLAWPDVTHKRMMGCPCYLAKGKMFAGLVTKGLVLTKLNKEQKEELAKKMTFKPFKAGSRTIKKWVHLTLEPGDLDEIMQYVRASYKAAVNLNN
jgi:TfoX/Sxy family transcriptional regulator of competence genes